MKFLALFFLSFFILGEGRTEQNYPELMVAPRASERLKREAIVESKNAFTTHMPIQLSGILTLASGLAAQSDLDRGQDPEAIGPKLAIAIGGGWIITTVWMQSSYRPYLRGYNEVKKMPYQSSRDQLAAERMAEEHVDEAARFARKLKWLAVSTNFIGSVYALSSAKSDSTGEAVGIAGMVASFLPVLFPYTAEQVSEDQRSYKKKVFGPLSYGQGLLRAPQGKLIPGLTLSTTF